MSFVRSGVAVAWREEAGSLLALAEAAGLAPPFSCRAGICMTCSTRLLSGEVAYFDEPLDEVEPGEILLCCTRPVSDVVIDV